VGPSVGRLATAAGLPAGLPAGLAAGLAAGSGEPAPGVAPPPLLHAASNMMLAIRTAKSRRMVSPSTGPGCRPD
jgi:hypothetical protein